MSENRHTALLILEGHIIDSLMLPSIMDMVMDEGGNFTVEELRVGQHKTDTSFCRIQVAAASPEKLDRIVRKAKELGAAAADDAEPGCGARLGGSTGRGHRLGRAA